MYLMKGAPKLPPAIRIFRLRDAPCCATTRDAARRATTLEAPNTRLDRPPRSAPTDPAPDLRRKALRSMLPPSMPAEAVKRNTPANQVCTRAPSAFLLY